MTLSNKLLSKLFETTNPSGASCLSRCLIYKVHTARSAAGLYLSTLSSLCQALFSSFFQNFFHANRFGPRQLLPQRFCILAHPPAFVKNFFRLFPNLFVPHSAAGRSLRCPRGQLGYNTTPASLCQLLFSNFFIFFHIAPFLVDFPAFCPEKSTIGGHLPIKFPLAEQQRM